MFGTKPQGDQHQLTKAGMSPAKVLAFGFLSIILTGTLLLMLPISNKSGRWLGFLEALFTATSATCVTGLTVVDTFGNYSVFGQVITLCLIQVGGLGFMLFATMALVAVGRRISLRNRMLLRETMSMPGLSGGVRTTIRFMWIAFSVEILGTILLSLRFIPLYGTGKGLYFGLYHAISAYCNAGFDLFGSAGSLQTFRQDPLVLLTVSTLIILGGLGFTVIADFADHARHPRNLSLHSKIVLSTSGLLLLFGFAFFAITEWDNVQTLSRPGANVGEKAVNAWFQSVTTRTAGFSSFDQAKLSDASKFLSSVLMVIGASPASTGGGIKTSTFFVVIMVLRSIIAGREETNAFGKRMSSNIGRTAQSILFMYLALIISGALFLSISEHGAGFNFLDLFFEEASALGTVGLSTLGTQNLRVPSRILLIVLMYLGRVGPLTIMLTLNRPNSNGACSIRFPEERIIVG